MFLFTVLARVGRIWAVGLHSTCVFAKTWKHPCGLVCLVLLLSIRSYPGRSPTADIEDLL